jgi:pimeloyl-ACP methyl ester carboxylesterase
MIDGLRRDGLNVLMPEYLGYGMSGGEASEQGCMEAAEAAYQYLVTEKRTQPSRLIVEGGSLGAAVAVDVAANHPVGGLVMLSGFSSIRDMTFRKYPYLPVDLLLLHPMDSVARLRKVKCPVLIVHGTADEVVPYDMSQILLDAAPPGTGLLSLPGAGHSDTLYLCGPSGALLPTNLPGPHALFTPDVHQTVREFFSSIFGPIPSARNPGVESGFDQKRR